MRDTIWVIAGIAIALIVVRMTEPSGLNQALIMAAGAAGGVAVAYLFKRRA